MQQTVMLTLEVEREDDQYVSFCPELDISSYGETVEAAIAHLKDALILYLETIERDGDRFSKARASDSGTLGGQTACTSALPRLAAKP